MSRGASGRPVLDPWNWAKVAQETVTHVVLLLVIWFSGLGYLGLALLMSAELVLICSLSIFIFPERGIGRHVWDILKLSGVTVFLLLFVFVSGGEVLRTGGEEAFQAAMDAVLGLQPGALKWALLASAVHLIGLAFQARLSPRPRMAWVQSAIMNGGITVIWLFVLIWLGLLLGALSVGLTRVLAPAASPDAGLVLVAVAVRFALALLVSRMSAKDMEEIAGNPYVD